MARKSILAALMTATLVLPATAQADNPGFGPIVGGEMYMCTTTGWPPTNAGRSAVQVDGWLSCSGSRWVYLNVCLQRADWVPVTVACTYSGWQWSGGGTLDQGAVFSSVPAGVYRTEAQAGLEYPKGSGHFYRGSSDSGWVQVG